MIRRILATAVKEFLQLRRDWRTALALLGMPIVLLMIYGYALSFDVTDIRLGVVDQSRTQASRQLVEAFLKSGFFVQKAVIDDTRPLDDLFVDETIQAAVVIPATSPRKFRAGDDVDPLRPRRLQSQTANTVLGYARQIIASQTATCVWHRGPGRVPGGPPGLVQPRPPVVDLSDARSARLHPHGGAVIATALAIVREKERGTMESAAGHAHPCHRAPPREGDSLPGHRLRLGRRFSLPRLVPVRCSHPRAPSCGCPWSPCCFSPAGLGGASSSRPLPRPNSWPSSSVCCRPCCRPSSCRASSFPSRRCPGRSSW